MTLVGVRRMLPAGFGAPQAANRYSAPRAFWLRPKTAVGIDFPAELTEPERAVEMARNGNHLDCVNRWSRSG